MSLVRNHKEANWLREKATRLTLHRLQKTIKEPLSVPWAGERFGVELTEGKDVQKRFGSTLMKGDESCPHLDGEEGLGFVGDALVGLIIGIDEEGLPVSR